MELADYIRNVADFPQSGITYKDITPLLGNADAFQEAVTRLSNPLAQLGIQKVVGIESRGFILGASLANRVGAGFVPIRKKGKLPFQTLQQEYNLEYGTDCLEIHRDAILPGEKVVIHDDVLATGGTAAAACELVQRLGGEVVQVSFLVELSFLNGKEKIKQHPIFSLVTF
ncbi:adenine phosphoribosyltransferase [Tunicatimonas pelagia]|uniref:adenine phosphoribosyltransferase n=1 Tax=Tunicatimonas pelagia TaxID=931531 RepID=UPI0026650F16|nr:adenine phosphoribosyltransferase [Tunicatimonas pelagia]WKN43232.1 adenine phosphoribosyltransferase [Tunicatimonas pelagia]